MNEVLKNQNHKKYINKIISYLCIYFSGEKEEVVEIRFEVPVLGAVAGVEVGWEGEPLTAVAAALVVDPVIFFFGLRLRPLGILGREAGRTRAEAEEVEAEAVVVVVAPVGVIATGVVAGAAVFGVITRGPPIIPAIILFVSRPFSLFILSFPTPGSDLSERTFDFVFTFDFDDKGDACDAS